MAIHESDVRTIDLEEEHDGPFISQVVFEASFHLFPLLQCNPIIQSSTDKHKRSYTHHIMPSEINKSFITAYLVKMLLDHLPPSVQIVLGTADEDVKRV